MNEGKTGAEERCAAGLRLLNQFGSRLCHLRDDEVGERLSSPNRNIYSNTVNLCWHRLR